MDNPTAKLTLYTAAKKINAIKNRLPKSVSNKLKNKLGIANIITHNTTNKVIKPTTKLAFFFENTLVIERAIYIIY